MPKESANVVSISKKLGLRVLNTKEHLDKMNVGLAKETLVESTVLVNELEKEILELLYFTDDLHKDLMQITKLLSTVYRKIEDERFNELKNYKHNLRNELETLKEHFQRIDTLIKG